MSNPARRGGGGRLPGHRSRRFPRPLPRSSCTLRTQRQVSPVSRGGGSLGAGTDGRTAAAEELSPPPPAFSLSSRVRDGRGKAPRCSGAPRGDGAGSAAGCGVRAAADGPWGWSRRGGGRRGAAGERRGSPGGGPGWPLLSPLGGQQQFLPMMAARRRGRGSGERAAGTHRASVTEAGGGGQRIRSPRPFASRGAGSVSPKAGSRKGLDRWALAQSLGLARRAASPGATWVGAVAGDGYGCPAGRVPVEGLRFAGSVTSSLRYKPSWWRGGI